LRVDKPCENAQLVADALADHPGVSWVTYPGLEDHPTHDNATEYLDGGFGGMIAFGVEGGYEAARQTTENTELASLLANVGDAKTLVIHPASTTHQQLSDEEKAAAGVRDDMVRLSVGIEDPADVVADLEAAIEDATR
jgi:O-acetylhomoserine (thiol)-lyase